LQSYRLSEQSFNPNGDLMKKTTPWQLAILAVVMMLPCAAQAQVFLVSAGYYSSQADGSNVSTYRFSTNSNSADFRLTLNLNGNIQNDAISFPLAVGSNNFTYSTTQTANPGPFGGLLLFFNSTGVSFNPSISDPVVANLAAAAPTSNSGSFLIPAAGIGIRNYVGVNPPVAVPYSGDTFFTVGGFDVSITAFSSTTSPSGSFTLNVSSAVPEPGSWALLGMTSLGGAAVCWYRRCGRRTRVKC
jgi:hypothetical protein